MNKVAKPPFSKIHHVGIVVKDIEKAIKHVESLGIGKFNHPRLPSWIEKSLFRGKPFDTEYKFLNMGPFIHPALYRVIRVGPTYLDPLLPPVEAEVLYRGKPFDGGYQIYKAKIGDKILELIQPMEGESPWKEHLDSKGEGIHHIAFAVDELDKEIKKLIEQGATSVFSGKLPGGLGGDYLDFGVGGLIVEVFKGYY